MELCRSFSGKAGHFRKKLAILAPPPPPPPSFNTGLVRLESFSSCKPSQASSENARERSFKEK
jgi:hypothetical protein